MQSHPFEPNPHVPVSCRICGEERRFHDGELLHGPMTTDQLTRLRELANDPSLPLQADHYVLLNAELEIRTLRMRMQWIAAMSRASGDCEKCAVAREIAEGRVR